MKEQEIKKKIIVECDNQYQNERYSDMLTLQKRFIDIRVKDLKLALYPKPFDIHNGQVHCFVNVKVPSFSF